MHYLLAAWPAHFFAFLACLQRASGEEYHFHDESEVTLSWASEVVQGNYWCLAGHRTNLVTLRRPFFATYTEYFHHIHPAEKTEYRQSTLIASGMIALPRLLRRVISEEPVLPQPWESLPSVIARTAHNLGHTRPELVLIPGGEYYRYTLSPDNITLLRLRDDYQLLEKILCLEEAALFRLTLHRFASTLQALSGIGFLAQSGSNARSCSCPAFLSPFAFALTELRRLWELAGCHDGLRPRFSYEPAARQDLCFEEGCH